MDANQGSSCKPCVDPGPESIVSEHQSTLAGEDARAIASDLLCCMCRQLLDEPMLLRCLHSCCRRCLKSASPIHETPEVAPVTAEKSGVSKGLYGDALPAAQLVSPQHFSFATVPAAKLLSNQAVLLGAAPAAIVSHQPSQAKPSVCCQTCMEATSVAEAVNNAFLAGKVRALEIRCDTATCAFCSSDREDPGAAPSAAFWCGACQATLCADCVTGLHHKIHKTHTTTSLHELQCGYQAIGVSTVSCVKHGPPYELAYFTCNTAKCLSCTADCIAARHDMLLLSDPRFATRLEQLKLKVTELASSVSSKSAVLQQHIDMAERLLAARQADLDQLRTNKRLVVDAIDEAYQEAEAALKDGYDELEAKALKLRRAAEQQLEQVRNAVEYSQQLLAADSEIVALIEQQELIVSKLNALQKTLDSTPSARDPCMFFQLPKYTESLATQFAKSCLPKLLPKYDKLCIDLPVQPQTRSVYGGGPPSLLFGQGMVSSDSKRKRY